MAADAFGQRLAEIEFAEGEADPGADFIPAEEAREAEARADLIGPDEFADAFCFVFDTAGALTGFASLPIADPERPAAQGAARAIHAIALKYPAVARWLLGPQSEIFGHLVAVGMFAAPKALAVRAELDARRVKPRPKAPPQASAPDVPEGARSAPEPELSGEDLTLVPG